MAIPSSGTIRLRGTIGAEWGYGSTNAQLNNKFGAYIGKAAGAATKMSDFFGKSAFTPMTVTSTSHTTTWDSGNWRYYKYGNTSGVFKITANPQNLPTRVLMVGGGASGGIHGGGGGGGGVYYAEQVWSVADMHTNGLSTSPGSGGAKVLTSPGFTYGPSYGQGNDGGTAYLYRRENSNGSGSLKAILSITGGGAGGGKKTTGLVQAYIDGKPGGSGGGGAAWYGNGAGGSATVSGQGRGGSGLDSVPFTAGGGGGARGNGQDGTGGSSTGKAGDGGVGYQFVGDGKYYGGGAGGAAMRSYSDYNRWFHGEGGEGGGGRGGQIHSKASASSSNRNAGAGKANTGGGGGGGGGATAYDIDSAAGGTGVIILGYQFKQ